MESQQGYFNLSKYVDNLSTLNRLCFFLTGGIFRPSIITLYFFRRPLDVVVVGFRLDVEDEVEDRVGFLLIGSGLAGSGDDSSTTI
jgi:hypothetical protein